MVRHSLCTACTPGCRAVCLLAFGLVFWGMAAVPRVRGQGAAPTADNAPFQLAYVPRDAVLVFAVRPATLIQREAVVPLREVIEQMGRGIFQLDVPPAEVAEVTLVLLPSHGREPGVAVILRTTAPEAARKLVARLGPDAQPREFAGQKYLRQDSQACLFLPDSKTVVFSPQEPTLRLCLAAGVAGATTTKWASRWETVAMQDAAAVVNTSLLRAAGFGPEAEPLTQLFDRGSPMAMQAAWQLTPLWQRSEHILADLQVSKDIALRVVCQSASDDEARQVHSALLTAVAAIRGLLSRGRAEIVTQEKGPGPVFLQSIDLVDEILEKAQVVRRDAQVGVVARINEDITRTLTKLAPPAAVAAQQAGSRSRSLNNLKQIALALHNYHDVYKAFPAAVQLGPKNTPRSWRVTILPFMEQTALWDQYRQDEPWDSENNKRILATMPDTDRCPLDKRGSTNTSYFGLTGRDTVFPGNRGARMADIRDGTSNTLMVVESKQETPWTKPEDIPFDAEQPLPKLGGWYPDGFCAAMCDGSARFFSHDKIDERTLRLLIMRSDGNPIQFPR